MIKSLVKSALGRVGLKLERIVPKRQNIFLMKKVCVPVTITTSFENQDF